MGLSIRGECRLVDFIHFIQFVIIHGILGVCAYRMIEKTKIRSTRADMMAMSMGAKSLMFIFWIIGTERVSFLKRFYSPKTNMVLMTLEVIFWAAVIGLGAQSLIQRGCLGIGCTLSYIVIGLSSAMFLLSLPVAYYSIRHWRMFRKTGMHPKDHEKAKGADLPSYPLEQAYKA